MCARAGGRALARLGSYLKRARWRHRVAVQKQFGPQTTPRDRRESVLRAIDPLEFAEARAQELYAMESGLVMQTVGKRVHQTLPRHMRRRAMSHNVKRLPVRLRNAAARESQDTVAPGEKGKKNRSRRYRRRPRCVRACVRFFFFYKYSSYYCWGGACGLRLLLGRHPVTIGEACLPGCNMLVPVRRKMLGICLPNSKSLPSRPVCEHTRTHVQKCVLANGVCVAFGLTLIHTRS